VAVAPSAALKTRTLSRLEELAGIWGILFYESIKSVQQIIHLLEL